MGSRGPVHRGGGQSALRRPHVDRLALAMDMPSAVRDVCVVLQMWGCLLLKPVFLNK